MESPGLRESILEFARQQIEPFTTGYVYEHVKEADSLSDVSNSLRKLVMSGHLARKKIDNVRYVYILAERAPADFETAIVADGKNNAAEKAAKKEEIKPIKKQVHTVNREANIPHDTRESAGFGGLSAAGKAEYEKPKQKNINRVNAAKISDGSDQKTDKSETIVPSVSTLDAAENMVPGLKPFDLPDSFTLKLQTPGGLIITITNGNVTA